MRNTSQRTIEMEVSKVELTSKTPSEYHVKLFSHQQVEVEMRCLPPSVVASMLSGKVTVKIETWED